MTGVFTPKHCYEMWEYIKRNPICKGKRCIYAEVLSGKLTEPYISICVRGSSDECRVGFRGTKPWRITGYHVAGMGSAVVRCGNTELWIEPDMCKNTQNSTVDPYGGPADIAIRVWWDKCLKITIVIGGGPYNTYRICP